MTQTAPTLNEADALRVDIYRLIAALLREAPTDELLGWLASLDIEQDGSRLAECWFGLSQAADGADSARLKRAHFGHLVGVIQGDIVPYASWYRNGELMEAALVALRGDLKALGFERNEHTNDPEDHLAALCEVMSMLIETTSSDQAHFFMQHLAPWASDCFNDLGQVDTAFYAALGQLGSAFMNSEEDRLAIEANHAPVRIVEP
ncbi:TorD/DmsD family molecular chaperone [Vreelandella arcis]|uniref:Chaperone TorD involved in molybdoenzyme TorA maturation n=1 Tax=Vreelandella arcis TaxID=416873 RepID=A0A1H0IHV4_9GAMM|nr:molecular chaperone TorD family protein [Halomonas arcis]SDO30945.1 chaperone TorD involved in molybdoenzyme TorA maturation [Halomonas arcis]